MADQDQPKLALRVGWFAGKYLAKDIDVVGGRRGVEADCEEVAARFFAGTLPETGLPDEVAAVLGNAGSANNEDYG